MTRNAFLKCHEGLKTVPRVETGAGNALNLDFVKYFDTTEFIPNIQLPVLFGGIAIYILGWILTYKISSSRFEKVDL